MTITVPLDLVTLAALLLAVTVMLFLKRSNAVREYRITLIDRISEANKVTIDHAYKLHFTPKAVRDCDATCEARWLWLHSVSYRQMVCQFWRPLDSFYSPMPDSEEEWPDIVTIDAAGTQRTRHFWTSPPSEC